MDPAAWKETHHALQARDAGLPERLRAQLESGESGPPTGMAGALRAMRLYAARLGGPAEWTPMLAVDAAETLLARDRSWGARLLPALAAWLLRHEPRPLHPEWLERAPLQEDPAVWVGSLDPVLEAADLESAGAVVARMLTTLQSPEAFHELILEAGARDTQLPGSGLVRANTGVRRLHGHAWAEDRETVFRVIEALRDRGVPATGRPRIVEAPEPPIEAAWRSVTPGGEGAPPFGAVAVYLRHAEEALERCRLRRGPLRIAVGRTLEGWFGAERLAAAAGAAAEAAAEAGTQTATETATGPAAERPVEPGALAEAALRASRDARLRTIADRAILRLECGAADALLLLDAALAGLRRLGEGGGALLAAVEAASEAPSATPAAAGRGRGSVVGREDMEPSA